MNSVRRHQMTSDQTNPTTNIVPFRPRSDGATDQRDSARSGHIIRMLDLSKYEQPRPPAQDYHAIMRANIAAIVLLAVLVFIAREDFCRLERASLCFTRSDCVY